MYLIDWYICNFPHAPVCYNVSQSLHTAARNIQCNSASCLMMTSCAGPEIVTAPENTHNHTGENVVLACEVRGFPVPKVEWSWTRVDGETFLDDSDVE